METSEKHPVQKSGLAGGGMDSVLAVAEGNHLSFERMTGAPNIPLERVQDLTWVDKSSPLLKLQSKALSRMVLAVLSIQIFGPLLASIGQSRAVALARYTDLCRKKCPKHNNHILGSQKSKRSTNCKKLL